MSSARRRLGRSFLAGHALLRRAHAKAFSLLAGGGFAAFGPGTVVGRRETVVEWANAELKLKVNAPQVASTVNTFPVTVSLDNVTSVESQAARVRVTLSDGATLARSEPPPTRADGLTVKIWTASRAEARQKSAA